MTIQQFISNLDASYNDYLEAYEGNTPYTKDQFISIVLTRSEDWLNEEVQDIAWNQEEEEESGRNA